jgi:uncharacterized protein YbbK (DUF523 family)
MTAKEYLENLRICTPDEALRLLVSACLLGIACGAEGRSYREYLQIKRLSQFENVKIFSFCHEDFVFGTPREIPDLEGGNGANRQRKSD